MTVNGTANVTSTLDVLPFVPPGAEGTPAKDGKPAGPPLRRYMVRGLTHRERMAHQLEVFDKVGPQATGEELRDEMRTAIRHMVKGSAEREKQLADVEEFENLMDEYLEREKDVAVGAKAEELPEEVKQLRAKFAEGFAKHERHQKQLARLWQPLRSLMRCNQERDAEFAALRVACAVVGWEGLNGRPAFDDRGRLTDKAMQAIPEGDLLPLANEVARLSVLTEKAAGESASPSGAPPTPGPSGTA